MALSKVLHSSRFIWAAEDDICSLSVGRRDQLEWVARYYTKLPDELAKGVEKNLTKRPEQALPRLLVLATPPS